jgi:hypothetical protein
MRCTLLGLLGGLDAGHGGLLGDSTGVFVAREQKRCETNSK